MTHDTDCLAVTVACSGRLSLILPTLREAGLVVAECFDAVGIVTGSVARSRYAELSRVPQITVETSEDISLPPPHAEIH